MVLLWQMDPASQWGPCLFSPDRSPEEQGAGRRGHCGEWLWGQTELSFNPSSCTSLCALDKCLNLNLGSSSIKWGNCSCYQEAVGNSKWRVAPSIPTSTEQALNKCLPPWGFPLYYFSNHQLQLCLSWGCSEKGLPTSRMEVTGLSFGWCWNEWILLTWETALPSESQTS